MSESKLSVGIADALAEAERVADWMEGHDYDVGLRGPIARAMRDMHRAGSELMARVADELYRSIAQIEAGCNGTLTDMAGRPIHWSDQVRAEAARELAELRRLAADVETVRARLMFLMGGDS